MHTSLPSCARNTVGFVQLSQSTKFWSPLANLLSFVVNLAQHHSHLMRRDRRHFWRYMSSHHINQSHTRSQMITSHAITNCNRYMRLSLSSTLCWWSACCTWRSTWSAYRAWSWPSPALSLCLTTSYWETTRTAAEATIAAVLSHHLCDAT